VSGGLGRDLQSAAARVPDRRRDFPLVTGTGDGSRSLVDQQVEDLA
jgi:hypothetical protein